jgi:hypothetical protein
MRRQITLTEQARAVERVARGVERQLQEKGRGVFASPHEAMGIITEEYHEAIGALQANLYVQFQDELIDIAVACIVGLASAGENWDWTEMQE